MSAYLSSPELILGFHFELESTERVAQQVKNWIGSGELTTIQYADANSVSAAITIINWSSVRHFSITEEVPSGDERGPEIVATAFLSEDGELSLYER